MPLLAEDTPSTTVDRLIRIGFALFIGTIVFSLAGTLLLKVYPASIRLFGPFYVTLVKAPTWTYMALLPVLPLLMYGPSLGTGRIAGCLVWGCAVGGLSELIGTSTGLPFGAYMYTEWLGPKLLNHVPYFIPLSWFALSIVSFDLAGRVTTGPAGRVLLGSLFMVLWDVSLDPAMSRAFPFWTYPGGGFYYGMPFQNWIGWLLVSTVIMLGYEGLTRGLRVHSDLAPRFYVVNCLFPIALCLLYGLYAAAGIGLLAMSVPFALIRLKAGSRIDPAVHPASGRS